MEQLRLLAFGAHPDDPDWYAGGLAALYAEAGHAVRLVALTNGDAGHHQMAGAPLARRRRAEAQAAGKVLGAEYLTLDNHDGEILPTLEVRNQVIVQMRDFRPDLVLCHRPWDYHPDHRYAGMVVQDAVLISMIGNILSALPPLPRMPVMLYTWDQFQKPYPFRPDVVVDVDAVLEKKLNALACHVSQFFEAMAAAGQPVPEDVAGRRALIERMGASDIGSIAGLYRERLIEVYGEQRGSAIHHAEAFEICEYGAPLTDEARARLFPMLPWSARCKDQDG